MIFHVALSLSLFGSLALALVLWRWADRVAGAHLLILFLLGVSVWIVGNELPTWFGPSAARLGLVLLATAALTSAVFLHFTLAFTRVPGGTRRRAWVRAGYVLGAAMTLLSWAFVPGRYAPFAGMEFVAMPNAIGWATSIAWALLAAAGQLVLLHAFIDQSGVDQSGKARRQIGAVIASSAWGLACMSGYAIAALDLPIAPWPLMGLPLYPVFLVYGILRYELLVANAWARRALIWVMLVLVAGLVMAAVGMLPGETLLGSRLLTGAGVGIAFLILGGPAQRLAARIVYPGANVTPDDLARWRSELAQATDEADLARRAGALLSRRLAMNVTVTVNDAPALDAAAPRLACRRTEAGWRTTLAAGWEAAPPGPRRVATFLGTLLAEEAQRLERASLFAEQERTRQTEARLAELGALAATVAHDVRNPLNIIGMAVATATPDVRAEVRDQIQRIARLADDLLDYAKPWSVRPMAMDLAALARRAAGRRPNVEVAPSVSDRIEITADADRIDQALGNLLDNACAAADRVLLDLERADGRVLVHVCDNGPGIPAELRGRIFQPFVSRAPGGTGLGLAIVGRIAAAHGGTVTLTERSGWATCFTIDIPVQQ
jgi:signal transduction histidine kinase